MLQVIWTEPAGALERPLGFALTRGCGGTGPTKLQTAAWVPQLPSPLCHPPLREFRNQQIVCSHFQISAGLVPFCFLQDQWKWRLQIPILTTPVESDQTLQSAPSPTSSPSPFPALGNTWARLPLRASGLPGTVAKASKSTIFTLWTPSLPQEHRGVLAKSFIFFQ